MMIHYLFAMEREADSFKKHCEGIAPDGSIDVIGIGAEDMPWYKEDDVLVNIGYCGGYKIPKGTIVEPVYVMNAWTRDVIRMKTMTYANVTPFPVEHRFCFTSEEFVTEPMTDCPSIYDMELFKIAEEHKGDVYALKIVSDNLNEEECENYNEEESWKRVAVLLQQNLPI